MAALGERMPYVRGYTDAATPAAQAFATGHGVCQDHAQVFVCCARLLGLPARYVSGYLATDFEHVASHAWAEVRLPDAAPTAAAGRDASHGMAGVRTGGGLETMRAEVLVKPGTADQQ